ncbi:MAG: tetratricopeptide repeat protein [Chloroflexi bacterium]|nr:tetratricopeptide repeat protein [Chloroflexota bacterium]
MSSDLFLEQVRVRFDASVAKSIVSSFRQEPLLWKALSDSSLVEQWLNYAGQSARLWTPGQYALFATSQDLVTGEAGSRIESILSKAQSVLASIRMTGLPPGNLPDATGLAIIIQEYGLNHPGWQGIHAYLQDRRNQLNIWKPSFAILPALVADLENFIKILTNGAAPQFVDGYTDLVLHALFSIPMDETARLSQLTEIFKDTKRDVQLSMLEEVSAKGEGELAKLLAARFVTADPGNGSDAQGDEDSVKSYQQLAKLHRLAGQSNQSTQAIQLAYDALNENHAASLRELALELEHNQPEEARRTWEEILRLVPENLNYRSEYAEFLIKLGETDYGLELIQSDQPAEETALLSLRYPKLREKVTFDQNSLKTLLKTPHSDDSRFTAQSDCFIAAQEAYNQKDFHLADDFIQKALIEDPNNLQVIRLNTEIQQRLADVNQAIESSALLSLFEPTNIDNKKDLANLYLQAQQPEKALGIYREIVTQTEEPKRQDLLTYADLAIKSGNPEMAIPVAEGFLAQDNLDGEALVTLVNAWLAGGEREKAVNLLNQTSTIAPERPKSWLSLAQLWTSMGNTNQAIESLRKAKAALPDNPEILLALGKLYFENQKTTEAIAALKQAYQAEPDNREISIALARAFLAHGYVNEAWTVIRSFENDYTADPELAMVLGQTMVALGDSESARKMLKFAWQSSPSTLALESFTGFLLGQQKLKGSLNAQETRELSQLAAAIKQKLASSYSFDLTLLLADAQAALGDAQSAYQNYLTLLDQSEAQAPQTYQHLQLELGRTALKLGMHDVSIASLQEALLTNPDDLAIQHVLADAYLAAGMNAEAFNVARSVFQLESNNLANLFWYSDFMVRNDNEREALEVLKDALRLRPEEKSIYLALAKIYSASGQKSETKETLSKLLALENISTEEYINVANLYLHLNEPQEAQHIISMAIADNPKPDFGETRDLAYSVISFGDPAAAATLLDQVDAKPEEPDRMILRADVLTANKQFLPALELLEPIVKEAEFSSDLQKSDLFGNSTTVPGFFPFTRDGVLQRAALLSQLTGDLQAAKRYADSISNQMLASVSDLQAEIAFSTGNLTKFESEILDGQNSETFTNLSPIQKKLVTINAMIQGDETKVMIFNEHLLEKDTNNLFENAVEAWLNAHNSDTSEKGLDWLDKLLNEKFSLLSKGAFKPREYFNLIWDVTAAALAAWEAGVWGFVDKALQFALSEAPILPALNKIYADFLVDKARANAQAQMLSIKAHAPKPTDPELTDQEIHEKQVSLAGRFIPAAEMLETLKLGRAVFSGRWNPVDDLNQIVKTGRQAAQALLVISDPEQTRQIITAFPEDHQVIFQAGLNHLQDQPATSLELAKQLLERQPENPRYNALAAFSQQDSHPDVAIKCLEKALKIWPNESEWHVITAAWLEKTGSYANAAKHLEAALHLSPKNATYWQMLGDVKVKEKDYHAAKDYFGKATELFPTNPEALESLATINQRLGEYQIALDTLEKAAEIDPSNPGYRESIAEIYLSREENLAAIEAADQVLRQFPKRERALIVKIKALQGLKRNSEAQQVNNAAISLVSDPVPFELIALDLDSSLHELGKLSASAKLAEKYPDNQSVLNNLAVRQLSAGLVQEADETLQKSLQLDPASSETLLLLGQVNRRQGNLDQAIARLSQAIKYEPSLINAYLEMGQTYQERREVDKAIDIYERAIKMVGSDPRPYVLLATAYKDSRDYKNAEAMFRQAAQISPNDPSIRRQLSAIVALNLVTNLQEASKRR